MDKPEADEFGDFDHSDNIYFETIFRQLNEKFETDEEQELFVTNVFKATVGKELRLCRNRKLAFGLEKLLEISSLDNLIKFVRALAENFENVFFHPSASHSWQVALSISFKYMAKLNEAFIEAIEKKDDSEMHQHLATLTDVIVQSARYILANLDKCLSDLYACHIIGSTMEMVGGLKPHQSKSIKHSVKESTTTPERIKVPPIFEKKSRSFVKHILGRQNLKDLMLHCTSSRVIQTSINVLESVDQIHCNKFVQKFIAQLGEETGGMQQLLTNQTASPIIEQLFKVCSAEQRSSLWTDHFRPHLDKLVIDSIANFVVQKFIHYCSDKSQAETIYADLEPLWEKICDEGHLGILVELSEICVKYCCCQAKFIEKLAMSLHCYEPVDRRASFFPLTIFWLFFEDLKGENFTFRKVNHHGSLLLQNVFKFQKPYLMVDSVLATLPSNLMCIICSPAGSFVAEAFVTSRTLGQKNRLSLASSLKGHYEQLACDKFGSRFLEVLWKNVDVNCRTNIIKELAQASADLQNHPFGHFVYKMSALYLYQRQPDRWVTFQSQGVKNKNLFDNILQEDAPTKKRRRFR